MNYEDFLKYIEENLLEVLLAQLEDDKSGNEDKAGCKENEKFYQNQDDSEDFNEYEIGICSVNKNNGIVLDALTIRKKGESVSPNLYLNSYFERYKMGTPIAVIMEELVQQYQQVKEEKWIQVEDITNFSAVKDKIVLRIVNYEKNKELLKKCPHRHFLDLAITFRYVASKDSFGVASSIISNGEFELWNVDLEELYHLALFNTMREFPWRMDSLARVIVEGIRNKGINGLPEQLIEELEEMENGVNMYVLTNEQGLNGATCILYDNVIRNFAKVQGCNIFILPSSVHEVMLVPENAEMEPEFLAELVVEANQSAVGLIDLLSNNVYYYDREREQIYIYGQN
jgi:hypothetical protein